MTRRRALVLSLMLFCAVGGAVVIYLLTASLAPSERARALAGAVTLSLDDLAGVAPGNVRQMQAYGWPLFAFRPNEDTWRDLKALDANVWDTTMVGYHEDLGLFLYWAVGTEVPCQLKHFPKGDVGANFGLRWLGGYYDPCRDPSYDYAGRTIKTLDFTAVRYSRHVPNLYPVRYEGPYGNKIRILPPPRPS